MLVAFAQLRRLSLEDKRCSSREGLGLSQRREHLGAAKHRDAQAQEEPVARGGGPRRSNASSNRQVLVHATGDGVRRRLRLLEPGRHHGALGARIQALAAVHAGTLIDHVDKPRLALDGVLLAGIKALAAAGAARDQDVVGDQRSAGPRRALVTRYVRLELVAKEVECLGSNAGHTLADLAERLLGHRGRKVANEVEVRALTLAGARVGENRAELVAALVAEDAPTAALAVESVEDIAHGVNGAVARANDAHVVAGEGDGIPKVRGHHKGAHGIAQVDSLDVVGGDASGAEKLPHRGLRGALHAGIAHVDHLALVSAKPALAGHERLRALGGPAHGRGQGLLADKDARGSRVVGIDKAEGVVGRDEAPLGKRCGNVGGGGGHEQADVLRRHAPRSLLEVRTEQLERNEVRAVERHEVDESHRVALLCVYSFHICLEIVNDALQIFGGNGYLKGMEVERAYRDAKICTIYEGTNEIQRVVIASHIIGKMPKNDVPAAAQHGPVTGVRKKTILKEGTSSERVNALVDALKADGYDFTVGIDIDTPITKAERVVSAGKGIGAKENMELVKALAVQAGAALGSSRPVAETLKYVPLNRYVGMSGQKFSGNLYIACGISGAGQHLKGIKDATTIVAINNNPNAPIFKNCDYGIVGDVLEILPLLTAALDNGEAKKPAPPMKKMKRAVPKKVIPTWKRYVCNGCGYEYDPAVGDPENDVRPGTLFDALPEEWICPECGEEKDQFIEV